MTVKLIIALLCVIAILIGKLVKALRKISRLSFDLKLQESVSVETVRRLAGQIGLNEKEMTEYLINKFADIKAKSDIWEVELPYGKWAEFPSGGEVNPYIRGFWLDCPARIIGVVMAKGSFYDWHKHHNFTEILIPAFGPLEVHIEQSNNEIKSIFLQPGETLIIPPNVRHFLPPQKKSTKFICIWVNKNQDDGFWTDN